MFFLIQLAILERSAELWDDLIERVSVRQPFMFLDPIRERADFLRGGNSVESDARQDALQRADGFVQPRRPSELPVVVPIRMRPNHEFPFRLALSYLPREL